eukprot:CAMPEP_0115880656 /NCGR_PEP_ID=MMETSP0287-20121206/27996_1 /TAXON_ID=412157 /ORGANISM="Chrysochromulina rotalis, Strain UIO044" /LENGTH=84 /DNA_ID=CAMNT_0003336499 /DNA_START=710 /DNA_END=961 /DNA_ORIENTATION=-
MASEPHDTCNRIESMAGDTVAATPGDAPPSELSASTIADPRAPGTALYQEDSIALDGGVRHLGIEDRNGLSKCARAPMAIDAIH